jgi:hypothetical protein
VLAIEEAMGVSAKLSAELNARGDNFKKVIAAGPLDFAACAAFSLHLQHHEGTSMCTSLHILHCRR